VFGPPPPPWIHSPVPAMNFSTLLGPRRRSGSTPSGCAAGRGRTTFEALPRPWGIRRPPAATRPTCPSMRSWGAIRRSSKRIVITPSASSGRSPAYQQLQQRLAADRCLILDGGIAHGTSAAPAAAAGDTQIGPPAVGHLGAVPGAAGRAGGPPRQGRKARRLWGPLSLLPGGRHGDGPGAHRVAGTRHRGCASRSDSA